MELESALLYHKGILQVEEGLKTLMEWAKTLKGEERKEAVYHLGVLSLHFHDLTLAVKDHNGGV